ncbi:MAG: DegT/DnrJ/EryC1/StrS family aminotransferase [Verrucomicrobia bacterium]|nr:DegT/DnrJ/EryC1/StrS family aminotransferase [Verrucomicrobiota bacterium]
MSSSLTRRKFLRRAAATGLAAGLGSSLASAADSSSAASTAKPAAPANPTAWPVFDDTDEAALRDVLRSGKWGRGSGTKVAAFEKAYAELAGAKHCIATASGTTALLTTLGSLDLGPGDEVILPPYTFVATFHAVTASYALPVFVDTDAASFQIDARKVAAAITDRTRVILPVHLGGSVADMDTINAAASAKKLPVVEDACQSWMAQWRGKSVGLHGVAGCFSFQASKNLTAGEGGAILTNDSDLAARCLSFQDQARSARAPLTGRGSNYRLTEFQGGLLLAQLKRFTAQQNHRNDNALYLSKLLREIDGIEPARLHDGCTRSAWHLYMFRYRAEKFAGLPREKFLAALAKEKVSGSTGYTPLNTTPHVLSLAQSRHYKKIYGERAMADWAERNRCPVNDTLCKEAVWFTQTVLLNPRSEMDRIAEAIRKVQRNAAALAKG